VCGVCTRVEVVLDVEQSSAFGADIAALASWITGSTFFIQTLEKAL
jgi:hypothetical protein